MDVAAYRRLADRNLEVLSRRLFFIAGAQKSGTTWVQRMLDAHPAILCAGEGHFMDALGVPLERLLRAYGGLMEKVAARVYGNAGFYRPPAAADGEFLLQSLAALMWGQRDIPPQVKVIGDKTPRNAAFMPQLRRVFPGCRFILVLRDGRDVLVSRVLHAQRVARSTPGLNPQDYSFGRRTEEYARDWAVQVQAAMRFAAQDPASCHVVRYEALAGAPESALENMFRFLDVDDGAAVVSVCLAAASFERLSGGRRPGEEDANSFLRKGVAGDWKQVLDASSLATFERVAGAALAELGYL